MTEFLLLMTIFAKTFTVKHLSECESLANWSNNAQLVEEAHQNRFAVSGQMPADDVGSLKFDFAHTELDLSKAHFIAFWWKIEGTGLRNFMVKIRNYPLVDGMEAVYSVWNENMETSPTKWRHAMLELSKPRYDNWGGKPDRKSRYITFRTQTEKNANVRLLVDDIVVLPVTFEWEIGVLQKKKDKWTVPVSLHNLTDQPLSILLGSKGQSLERVTVSAQGAHNFKLSLPKSITEQFSHLKPLESLSVPLWAKIVDSPEIRMERMVKMVKPVELPSHPRLLFNSDGILQLKRRINQYDWAKERWNSIQHNVNKRLDKPVELPPRGGNWWHWYACPKHGASLHTGKKIGKWQWEHICPVDDEVLQSDRSKPSRDYDGCVISGIHGRWSRAVRDLGLAYQLTDDPRYAKKAREILLAYADKYLDYPLHTTRGEEKIGGGRVGPQTLDEAVWLIPVCQGADLIWDRLSKNDQETIAQKLLLPAAKEVILPHRIGVHNIQCWKNSAVGLVGFLLDDSELIHEAIHNPERGYWKQMKDGVLPDGGWWEGAWGYHFYTLSALWSLIEASHNCGIDLYGEEFKKMFDAPLKFAMPNLHLPAFNDSGEVNLLGRASLYELAYSRYQESSYLSLLDTSNRRNNYALWFGKGELPEASPIQWQSINYQRSGYAILAQGEGKQATWLCLKYGPHGGGHGHPDKLNFVLYARGQVVSPDPGTAKYGLPIQGGWYRTTLAHNTLIVDESSQKRAEGKCIVFGNEKGMNFTVAEAGDIYDGVRFVRSVVRIEEKLFVFVDQIQCDQKHLLDIAYHQHGVWDEVPEGTEWTPPDKDGYRYLRDATIRQTSEDITFTTQLQDEWRASITLAGNEPTEIITATGVGDHIEDRVPLVLFRRRTKETALVCGVSLDGEALQINLLPVSDENGETIPSTAATAVQLVDTNGKSWCFVTNPDQHSLKVQLPDGSKWQTDSAFDVR